MWLIAPTESELPLVKLSVLDLGEKNPQKKASGGEKMEVNTASQREWKRRQPIAEVFRGISCFFGFESE